MEDYAKPGQSKQEAPPQKAREAVRAPQPPAQTDWDSLQRGMALLRGELPLENARPEDLQALAKHIGNDAMRSLLPGGSAESAPPFSPAGLAPVKLDAVNHIKTAPPRLAEPFSEASASPPGAPFSRTALLDRGAAPQDAGFFLTLTGDGGAATDG